MRVSCLSVCLSHLLIIISSTTTSGTTCDRICKSVPISWVKMPPPKTRLTDTSLWLHNKLGTSNDMWSGASICSQLNQEVLENIKDCFPDLQSQVKLKLILSFLHIPRRNVTEVSIRRTLRREILILCL